jgi:phage-related holin
VNEQITKIYELLLPYLQEHIVLYFICSLIYYALGGVDEHVITLFLLQIIHIICLLLARKSVPLASMLRVYIIIATSVLADDILQVNTAKLRVYLLLYYSYNEIVDIFNILGQDKRLSIPKKLLEVLNKTRRE